LRPRRREPSSARIQRR